MNTERRKPHVGRWVLLAVLVIVAIILLESCFYVVHKNEYGIIRQFGAVVDVKSEPGIYFNY